MQQQRAPRPVATERHDELVLAVQRGADARGEALAEQEVAVAVHQVQRGAGGGERGERGDERLVGGIDDVVAEPDLEQVPEDPQRARAVRPVDEASRQRGDGGTRGVEVQVGDEQGVAGAARRGARRPRPPARLVARPVARLAERVSIPRRAQASSTVTDSIVTGSFGTSWCGPFEPVETLAIASTAAMPSTTRPNTQ